MPEGVVLAEDAMLPWPAGAKVPRWARDRRGRIKPPDVYASVQLDNLDCYHVGLYRFARWFPRVVEITEPAEAPTTTADATRAPGVTITRVVWPRDPLEAFERAVAKYQARSRYFGDHRN